MTVLFTCDQCEMGVHVHPSKETPQVQCPHCDNTITVKFTKEQEQGVVKDCPKCERQDFYSQRDFNRKVGIFLYLIPTAVCIFWGLIPGIIGYFLLWCLDFFLFQKLSTIAICYNCQTIFRDVSNIKEIGDYNHEMNDRIVYSGQDFKGKPLEH
jgi:predicted RNA-binding Zn-ribbon protein involved in translation (DUF1610 family)